MSKTGRTFVGLIALATTMLTVAPMSAGAKPRPQPTKQTVSVTIDIAGEEVHVFTETDCGGPLTMEVQSRKRLRLDWPEGTAKGVLGLWMGFPMDGWHEGCHGATDFVPEGMSGGLLILNETPRGVELISRFDYDWQCTAPCLLLYELTGLFPGLDLTLMGVPQDVEGTLSFAAVWISEDGIDWYLAGVCKDDEDAAYAGAAVWHGDTLIVVGTAKDAQTSEDKAAIVWATSELGETWYQLARTEYDRPPARVHPAMWGPGGSLDYRSTAMSDVTTFDSQIVAVGYGVVWLGSWTPG